MLSSVDRISASESSCPSPSLPIQQISLQIHVYQPSDAVSFDEVATSQRGDVEEVTAASVCELPSMQWEGLWESLIYADNIKSKLLDYIYATVLFSDAGVDCESSLNVYIPPVTNLLQSMLYLGIALFCYTVRRGQERLPYAVHWLRSSPFASQIGT